MSSIANVPREWGMMKGSASPRGETPPPLWMVSAWRNIRAGFRNRPTFFSINPAQPLTDKQAQLLILGGLRP